MTRFRRLSVASPHRYPDLARLWHRFVRETVTPAFERAGLETEVRIFCDANPDNFLADDFPAAHLERPRAHVRDFVEFYDAALAYDCDLLLFLDADVFILDGPWVASGLGAFDDPAVAAVCYLRRGKLPGVYALLCRTESFRRLPAPAMAPSHENMENWPDSVNRGPGERAALMLQSQGMRIVDRNFEASEHLSDFHGTTVIRASREMFAAAIGEDAFESLVAEKRYFAMGAYDNVLLARIYRAIFRAPFARGTRGEELGGSLTEDALRRAMAQVRRPPLQSALIEYFARSDRAALRMAHRTGIPFSLPEVLPAHWSAPA